MTQGCYSIPEEWFINQIIRKFQAYAIVDIENKIQRLLLADIRDDFFEERISNLRKKRTYYEKASKAELLADLIESARERSLEEEISHAKVVFDQVLSKRRFSSYHKSI